MVLICKPDEAKGGEHVASAAAESGILGGLTEWVTTKKMPTWGTCAGMILLSDRLVKDTQKIGGQG